MNLTQEKPTPKNGEFWWWTEDLSTPVMPLLFVESDHGHLVGFIGDISMPLSALVIPDSWWAGPIPMPVYPSFAVC